MKNKNPFSGRFGPEKVDIPPGESREIGFGIEWSSDKKEVKLFFGEEDNDTLVLNEETAKKGKLILTINGKNVDPVRIELIPDFDKHEIYTREILDVDEKKKFTGKDDARLVFGGMTKEKLKG